MAGNDSTFCRIPSAAGRPAFSRLFPLLVAAAALSAFPLSAQAQNGLGQGGIPGAPAMMQGPGIMNPGIMGGPAMMGGCLMMGDGANPDARIASLKSALGITEAQKAEWEAYAAKLKTTLEAIGSMQQSMMQMMLSASPVDRLNSRIAAMESGVALLKEMQPALAALYAALSDEQKKKAADLMSGMGCMM